MTRIIKVDKDNLEEAVSEASKTIRRGGLVAFPTETVYGLGADAYNVDAVKKIFKVKGRPPDNPLIIHIDSIEYLQRVFRDPPESLYRLARRLWPGPFTIVYYRGDVPDVVTAGLDTAAVRMPAHPVALKLIEYSGTPIAAPSANKSGRPSPTTAEHVLEDLGGEVDIILDAGETLYGVESTVIDFTTEPPTLLRPGPITPEDLSKALGIEIRIPPHVKEAIHVDKPLSPGMKYRHYAPDTYTILVEYRGDLDDLVRRVLEVVDRFSRKGVVGVVATDETLARYKDRVKHVLSLGSRRDLYTVAKNLFNVLREADKLGLDYLVVEGFEDRGLGLTIMNRLRKAASERI